MSDDLSNLDAGMKALVDYVRSAHAVGDEAASAAAKAKARRVERKNQSLNRAARAAATGGETTMWLSNLVMKRFMAKGATPKQAAPTLVRLLSEATGPLDDLQFEMQVIGALRPDTAAARKK
jgi:hypothetical protein